MHLISEKLKPSFKSSVNFEDKKVDHILKISDVFLSKNTVIIVFMKNAAWSKMIWYSYVYWDTLYIKQYTSNIQQYITDHAVYTLRISWNLKA